jgi:hypothetical protein
VSWLKKDQVKDKTKSLLNSAGFNQLIQRNINLFDLYCP